MHKLKRTTLLTAFLLLPLIFPGISHAEWTQDAGNAQRTGYTAEEPQTPWTLLWSWNGPDANGGTTGHFYDAGRSSEKSILWEGRTVTGASFVFVPALHEGMYALNKSNGQVAWNSKAANFASTPAYDADTQSLFAGATNGLLYKFNSQNGSIIATYQAQSPLNKSVLLVGDFVYVVSADGRLHKVNKNTMQSVWVYTASSPAATPPSYSSTRDVIVYATRDLFVHAVSNLDGSRAWRVKPTPHNPSDYHTFEGFWPTVAEQHGIVFVRMNIGGNINFSIFSGPGYGSKFPNTNSEIKAFLTGRPDLQNLFALSLDTGQPVFLPAVGYGGVESLLDSAPILMTGPVPVIKNSNGQEYAYTPFRNGQTADQGFVWDGRWDSHIGEMVLDNQTVNGYLAGDLRFVQFTNPGSSINSVHVVNITDEQSPLTMAGNTLFFAHWGGNTSVTILDRSDSRGDTRTNPITSRANYPLVRRLQTCSNFNPQTHFANCSMTLYNDGKYYGSSGWWTYWNVYDPPTPSRSAYSEGILPRYTYVSDGLVITEGNGGELMVFSHSGTSAPTPTPTLAATPTPSPACRADVNGNGTVEIGDISGILFYWGQSCLPAQAGAACIADVNANGSIEVGDIAGTLFYWGQLCN